MRIVLLLVGAVLVVGLVGGAYYLGQKQSPTPASPVVPAPTIPPIPIRMVVPPVETPTDPNVKVFTSSDLGVSFNYLEKQNGEVFGAKQIGSKVYVYQTKFPVTQGQYIEVFSKTSGDDLKTAIEKKFLANYSKNDCFAEITKNPVAGQTVPATFVLAQIAVPTSPNDGMEQLSAKWDKCPSPYTATNGIAYFATDTQHPDKFVFFSIGQYAIDAGPSLPWQSTLKFL